MAKIKPWSTKLEGWLHSAGSNNYVIVHVEEIEGLRGHMGKLETQNGTHERKILELIRELENGCFSC